MRSGKTGRNGDKAPHKQRPPRFQSLRLDAHRHGLDAHHGVAALRGLGAVTDGQWLGLPLDC